MPSDRVAIDWGDAIQAERALMAIWDCVHDAPNAAPLARSAADGLPDLIAHMTRCFRAAEEKRETATLTERLARLPRFPIQQQQPLARIERIPPATVPRIVAEIAYAAYARQYGRRQSLDRLAERAGFGRNELVGLLSEATEADVLSALRAAGED